VIFAQFVQDAGDRAPVRAGRCGQGGDLDNRFSAGAVVEQQLVDLLHQRGMVASAAR
jgi:hypothetical protein